MYQGVSEGCEDEIEPARHVLAESHPGRDRANAEGRAWARRSGNRARGLNTPLGSADLINTAEWLPTMGTVGHLILSKTICVGFGGNPAGAWPVTFATRPRDMREGNARARMRWGITVTRRYRPWRVLAEGEEKRTLPPTAAALRGTGVGLPALSHKYFSMNGGNVRCVKEQRRLTGISGSQMAGASVRAQRVTCFPCRTDFKPDHLRSEFVRCSEDHFRTTLAAHKPIPGSMWERNRSDAWNLPRWENR